MGRFYRFRRRFRILNLLWAKIRGRPRFECPLCARTYGAHEAATEQLITDLEPLPYEKGGTAARICTWRKTTIPVCWACGPLAERANRIRKADAEEMAWRRGLRSI